MKQVDKSKWDCFDEGMLLPLIKSCEVVQVDTGIKLVNITKLHDIFRDEVNSVQSTLVVGHLNQIIQEMESCVPVTEILFIVAPAFVISNDVKQTQIREILQALLTKVTIDLFLGLF